jgi:hypothetical protein
MSLTISKRTGPLPVHPFKDDLVITTVVFNPLDDRLTISVENLGHGEAALLLNQAAVLLCNLTGDRQLPNLLGNNAIVINENAGG